MTAITVYTVAKELSIPEQQKLLELLHNDLNNIHKIIKVRKAPVVTDALAIEKLIKTVFSKNKSK